MQVYLADDALLIYFGAAVARLLLMFLEMQWQLAEGLVLKLKLLS